MNAKKNEDVKNSKKQKQHQTPNSISAEISIDDQTELFAEILIDHYLTLANENNKNE
jgi:hypothetical protein